MKDPIYILGNDDTEDSLSIKENIFKYLHKWHWFLFSIGVCLLIGFLFIRYTPVIYSSEAKIKIIDDSKDFDIAEDALSLIGGGSKINLDNEIEVIKSFRIASQVVTSLGLDIEYFEVGNIKTQQVYKSPILVTKQFLKDTLKKPISFKIRFEDNIQLIETEDKSVKMDSDSIKIYVSGFPILIRKNKEVTIKKEKEFLVTINNKKETAINLIDKIDVNQISSQSDVLSLKMKNESPELSEAVINEFISKFNTDGILDRQLVSKRTLDFIDDRFRYLSEELDSIEIDKKDYKKSNNLSYIEADAGIAIEKKSVTEREVFKIETQIELSKLLEENLNTQKEFSLLPANIGVENENINSLISDYNLLVLNREKLIVSAGSQNPAVQLVSSQIINTKSNINNTVNTYQNQLKRSLKQLNKEKGKTGAIFSRLPEKEKMLRSIERQQFIKENLFLLLLQKREEAAINFAVTAPSIKVVDYALTNLKPISPKKIIILGISLFFGFLIPLASFFLKFFFDTKIKNKSDLQRITSDIPILAEIPSLKEPYTFFDANERSVKAESFRILSTNVNYLLPKERKGVGQIIYVTSSIKGEGKTLTAINLSIAFASLKKKVLLIGADLRNPQLHSYFKTDRNGIGLSDFLYNPNTNWKECINKQHNFMDVCYSGPIPPNASQLLANENLTVFLNFAKNEYDYIIVDTAPTILVADTLLISHLSDLTIFVTRSQYTDKRLLQFSKDLNKTKKLKNMAYLLNDVGFNKRTGGYNYGYGYGYTSDEN